MTLRQLPAARAESQWHQIMVNARLISDGGLTDAAPHPPHEHPHEEMIVVKEGNIEVMIGADWKPIGPGSVAFFAPNTPHGIRNVSDKPASYHVLIWRTPATLNP